MSSRFRAVFALPGALPGALLSVLIIGLFGSGVVNTAAAQELTAQGINQRLLRLERVLDNSVLIDMVQRMESLQAEVRQLRGELEQKTNEIESMRERQRKLYLDTDGRLQVLETGGGGLDSLESLESLEGLDDLESLESLDDVILEPVEPEPVQQPVVQTPIPSSRDREEKLDYQNAYDLLILGRNFEAIAEFQNFLSVYPDGTYSDNAHYWLGEANYVERRYEQAIDRFNVVIRQFPSSRKVPDARLRKGFALFELRRYPQARTELELVQREYQGRSIAALARRRIEQMNNAGL